ncbi:hypothetical protein PAJ34TS1_59750 [Paenibacillus azoreducens]|uniref:Uncharacterized protein n=1 Tax=Paenibacillus azoreducens TaxID=116718 RepID=A0A919YGT2_9BACL|nr:hypothetical protein J34TS1_32000 [Paenibacillus azoreducens]
MELLNIVRYENENTFVDFKRSQYQNNESFLKDIMAMANTNTDNTVSTLRASPLVRKEYRQRD